MFRRALRFGQFLILFHSINQLENVVMSSSLAGFGASSGIWPYDASDLNLFSALEGDASTLMGKLLIASLMTLLLYLYFSNALIDTPF